MNAKGKNILLLSSWYPNRCKPFLGNFVQRQAYLLGMTNNITVVHLTADASIKKSEIVKTHRDNVTEILGYYPDHKWRLMRFLREYILFKQLIRDINSPDIIHAHVCLPKGYLFLRAKRFFKRPLVITEHGSYFESTKQSGWTFFQRLLIKRLERKTDQFIAVSEVLKQDMERVLHDKAIQVIPNAIDMELFRPSVQFQEDIHFLHVSTLDDNIKNVSGLLTAFHQFVQNGNTEVKLTIVSDEPYADWKEFCNDTYPDLPVKFVGPLNEREIVPYFQNCSAFILNSTYETFSIVLAEAWSCGKPVLSTPVGIARQLPKELGIQIEIGNNESLTKAMEEFVIRRDTFKTDQIREKASAFSSTQVIEALNKLYDRLSN